MNFHRLANIYPLMTGEDFDSLCNSVKVNGLRNPIVTLNGEILDGRNRFRACEATGTKPTFKEYQGKTNILDLFTYVRDLNEERRHLTSSQKAAIAVSSDEIVVELSKEAEKRMKAGKSNPNQKVDGGQVSDRLASMFGTNRQYVSDAKRVKEESPRMFEQVINGDLSLVAAKTKLNLASGNHKAPVTYNNQPAIQETHGAVPLAGNSHIYTVNKLLWPEDVENLLLDLLIGRSLHLCCGKSKLGTVRLDLNEPDADIQADAAHTGLDSKSFDTVLCDPPYNGEFQWNHDLLDEMARLAKQRIIFQHWFIPANPDGLYKKNNNFHLSNIYVWQPRTYFGRAQLVSVFDWS